MFLLVCTCTSECVFYVYIICVFCILYLEIESHFFEVKISNNSNSVTKNLFSKETSRGIVKTKHVYENTCTKYPFNSYKYNRDSA